MRQVLVFVSVMNLNKHLGLRILFIHSGSDLYGASRSLLRLSSRLVRDGMCVKVVLPFEGPLVSALRENGVIVLVQKSLAVIERQAMSRPGGIFQLFYSFVLSTISLLRLFREFKPDIVHTMTAVTLSPGFAAKLAGIPHVWHVRESFAEFGYLWRYYKRYMLSFSTKLICVSTPIASQFNLSQKQEKVQVIHNGFPVEEFSGVEADRVDHFREQYVIAGVNVLIGVVGRIKFQRKGQEILVKAAALLRDRFPNVRFLCVGSPYPGNESHLTNLLNLIRELDLEDYVLYTGEVADIKAAIAGLDILVLPSVQTEPFAGVVVEAMALSRPVIATAIGGSLEQVVDGQTGYLVRPGDPLAMARAIEKLLLSPAERASFGGNGRRRFLEYFEFKTFYEKMLALYQELMKDGP